MAIGVANGLGIGAVENDARPAFQPPTNRLIGSNRPGGNRHDELLLVR